MILNTVAEFVVVRNAMECILIIHFLNESVIKIVEPAIMYRDNSPTVRSANQSIENHFLLIKFHILR